MIDRWSLFRHVSRHRSAPRRLARRPSALPWWPVLALLGTACGGGEGHPPPAPAAAEGSGAQLYDSRLPDYDPNSPSSDESGGPCEPGTTRECRVYLPAHDGIQPCFVGEQRCVNSSWSSCADALLVDANQEDAAIEPAEPVYP